jgi:hypothetical protein
MKIVDFFFSFLSVVFSCMTVRAPVIVKYIRITVPEIAPLSAGSVFIMINNVLQTAVS